MLYDEIHFRRQSSQGNYDGIIGLCKNFSYSARPDGGFNCTTELMAVGETVSSVKGNVIQYIQPSFKKKPGGSGGASDDVIGTDVASHMPILLDLLEKTHDFRYNINSVDVWGKDGTAVNRAEESRMSITNGENDQLGDEDDEVEIGAKFNRSAAYQKKASISGNGFWNPFYSERVNIYNIDRADLEEQYKNEFLNTNTDCPHDGGLIIKEDVHIINFKEGRTGWQNFLVGSVGSISTLITANINIGLAAASQLLAYQNDNLGCSEAYIRLDALCYMINKYVLPSEKKFFESQKNENRIVAFQTMTYNPYLNRYVANPYKQYEGNVLDLLKENLGSSPGFNIMRGVMDMSTDPYVCLMPKQVTGATTKEYVDGIESVPVANNFGFQKDHFLEDGVFAKSFPLKAEASKTEASANPLFDFQQNSFMAGIIEEVARKKAGVASAKEASQGYIGHIMLNIRHLLKIHDGIYTKEGKVGSDYSVGKFMEKVVESINKVMAGNVKLGLVTDNTHPGVTSIVDLNMDPQVDYKDIFKFDVLSSTSAVRNFSFNSAIPSAMASTIAVGAGDPDNADSLDAVTFAAMNRGLKNRLYQKQVGASGEVEVTDEEKEAAKEKMKAEFEEVIEITNALVQFQVNVCSGQMFEADIEDDSKAGNIRTQVSRLKDLVNILSIKDDQGFIVNDKEKNPPSSTPIPIKLDMTFDGISGLTMGQLFRVNETRLPQAYRNKNVIFVVVAEDQTVDENGNWTTKISGQMQLFPGKPSSDAAASVLPKTAGVEGFDPKPICDALYNGMNQGGTADSVYTILDPLSPEEVRMVDIYWRYDIEQRNQGDNLLMWLHDDLRTNNAEVEVYNKYADITCADGGYALADRVKSGAAHIPADMFNNYRGPNKRFLKTAGEKKAEKKKNDKKINKAKANNPYITRKL